MINKEDFIDIEEKINKKVGLLNIEQAKEITELLNK